MLQTGDVDESSQKFTLEAVYGDGHAYALARHYILEAQSKRRYRLLAVT
jgi:hypothetical protein